MKILLGHDVPHSLRPQFPDEHEGATVQYQGGANYDDDQLLSAAEKEFDKFGVSIYANEKMNLHLRFETGSRSLKFEHPNPP